MRIGLFTHVCSPMVNGVAVSVKQLEEELKRQGHDVFVISNNYNGMHNDFNNTNDLKVVSIPLHYQKLRTPILYNPYLFKELDSLNLDVIHCHSDFGIAVMSRAYSATRNIPLVQTYHCNYIGYAKSNFGNIIANISKLPVKYYSKGLCYTTNRIISPSKENFRLLREDFKIKREIDLIPNGLNLNKFRNTNVDDIKDLKNKYKIMDDDFVLLSLSRLSKEKRIDQIIELIPYLKECDRLKLLIVGGGPDEKRLHDLVNKLNLNNVIFTGEVNNEEVNNYYKLATCFITNSNAETQGLTVIEALASSIPVICLNDPLYEDIVKSDVNGIKYDSINEVPNIVKGLYYNREYIKRIKEYTTSSIDEYDIKNTTNKIYNIYKEEKRR